MFPNFCHSSFKSFACGFRPGIGSVACRGLVMHGTTACWLYDPYQILVLSSHNMTSYSHFQTNVLVKFVDTTCCTYYSTCILLACYCTMCHCNECNLSALQVRRPEQNTALKAETEQFITAKISGNALKQGSRTHSVLHGEDDRCLHVALPITAFV